MKTLLSKIKMETLSLEDMAQITGGSADEICVTVVMDTWYSDGSPPSRDEDVQCFPYS